MSGMEIRPFRQWLRDILNNIQGEFASSVLATARNLCFGVCTPKDLHRYKTPAIPYLKVQMFSTPKDYHRCKTSAYITCHLYAFYSPTLLYQSRIFVRKSNHTLTGISDNDIIYVKKEVSI